MKESERNKKRIIIIIVYLLLFFLAGLLFYYWLSPAPTCFDGKKNQRETEVDCGGPCAACQEKPQTKDLVVREKHFVHGGQNKFDVIAKVFNPNNRYGAAVFSYVFVLKGGQGNVLAEKSGRGFILPAETKYIIESNLEANETPVSAEFSITNERWQEFEGYETLRLNVYNKRYDLISGGIGYGEAYGLLRNESVFDFNKVKINVVLRDSSGNPLAANTNEMNTVNAGEQRNFRLVWPFGFPGEVQSVEMEAEADVYDTLNFIKRYFPAQKF